MISSTLRIPATAVRRDPAHTSICRERPIMRRHHFKDSGIDVLPLGDPVDLTAVVADDALIDALSGDVLAELLADDVLIEALVARMPPGTAPPRGDVLARLLVELLAAWMAEARGYGSRRWNVPRDPTDLDELSNGGA
jgi:hypothetical protein